MRRPETSSASRPRWAARLRAAVLVALLASAALAPGTALADGGAEGMENMAKQPARVLAQQAISLLRVLDDREEALERIDAALESEDQENVDVGLLRQADEALEEGDAEQAIARLDEALSRPLGAAGGRELHDSGREFKPARSTQEVVGIALGALLAAMGVLAVVRMRPRRT